MISNELFEHSMINERQGKGRREGKGETYFVNDQHFVIYFYAQVVGLYD